jgi:hypothetical protein
MHSCTPRGQNGGQFTGSFLLICLGREKRERMEKRFPRWISFTGGKKRRLEKFYIGEIL